MSHKLIQNETASFEEVLISNVFTPEAILNVLEKKGLISRQEVLDEIMK